jgi:hypothetical protein
MKLQNPFRKKKIEYEPFDLPGLKDDPNPMQFDEVYLYKYALMMAIQDMLILSPKKPKLEFQSTWNSYVEKAGAYIISQAEQERNSNEYIPSL